MAQDVVTRLKLESGEFNAKLKNAANELNRMTTVAEQEGTAIAAADEKNIKFFQDLGKMQTASTNTSGKMRELTSAIEAATIMYNRMDSTMKKGEGGRALNASINQLQGKLKGLQTEMAAVQGQMTKGVGSKFAAGLGSAFSMFGPAALAATGVAAALGGMKKVMSDMVQINMQFEQGTAVLASILGKTTDEITALTNQAKQLGATTRYTAMQITELQTNLARLGFTEQEILNSTKAIQAFATATGADLGEAANLAGAALRGFGMNATEMERAASVMAVSTTKSALSFEKLATAVPIVAPVAKQFGFTIEDTITLLGKLSDAGMDASTAATATRNIFLKMADGSGKLSQAMGKPVHSVEEFGEALKEMKEKGMSLNDILKMVGVRSTAAFAVFADNADTLKDFKQSITDCGDAMGDMEQKQINTLQGSLIILNSAWEGLMLTFSESNGTIKKVVDSLTNLLGAWTKWRQRNAGGDEAIKSYQLYGDGLTKEAQKKANDLVSGYRAGGTTDEQMVAMFDKEKKALEDQSEEMQKVYEEYRKIRKENGLLSQEMDALAPKIKKAFALNFDPTAMGRKEWDNLMTSRMAPIYDQIAVKDYQLSLVTPAPVVEDTNGKGKGGLNQDKSLTAKKRAQIEAQMQQDIAALDKANMVKLGKEEEYEDQVYAIKKAALEQIKQLYAEDSKEYALIKAKDAQLDIQYQNTKLRLAQQTNREITNSDREAEREKEAALRHQKQLDYTILRGLTGKAKQAKWTTADLGLDGIKAKIDTGVDITENEWSKFQDKLNERLAQLGLDPIEINFETGNIETVFDETKAQYQKFMDDLSSGVGAISTIGNAFDDLKNIGEDLASAFSGEMDAWDALMTVFNSGIGIMETVIGVMDAINTLNELSIALSGKRKAEQALETAEVVGGKMAEATAEGTEAAASGAAAGANAAEGATAAGKSVAWIPIVGPILAAAAIAATIGAMIAAMSKAKSAGSFSTGGVVGGNSNSGDRLMAYVNSGETILTPQQADKAMAGIQGGGQTVQVQGQVSGTNILLVASNAARQMNRNGGMGFGGNSVALPLIG